MHFWYKTKLTWQSLCLLPLSALVLLFTALKRARRSKTAYQKPVLVVGNIAVGGTGKTPMILWLAKLCQHNEIRVGVVSRGYGAAKNTSFPFSVSNDSTAEESGDEPKLISMSCHIPVVIDPNRDRAVRYIIENHNVDLVISDDGMQHYGMYRDIEILMIDGKRGLGNGLLLPAGPLREHPKRINDVDFIVSKQSKITLPYDIYLAKLQHEPPKNILGELLLHGKVNVYSGIGNFESFIDSVKSLGFEINHHMRFSDHQKIDEKLLVNCDFPIIITEKDAVKLDLSSLKHVYVLPLGFELAPEFGDKVIAVIKEKINEKCHRNPSKV